MLHPTSLAALEPPPGAEGCAVPERPSFEVIPLDCEITSYAPDGDAPRV